MNMPINDNDGSTAKEIRSESLASPTAQPEKAISAAAALQEIANLVKGQAGEIALGLLEAAKGGQLAHAKYLLEIAGIYPRGDENKASGGEESLTYRLLKEFGMPTEPGPCGEVQATNSDGKGDEGATADACSEDGRLAS